MIRNDPVPSQEELDIFYNSSYRESYKGKSVPRLRQVWRNFDRTRKHIVRFKDIYKKGGRWLDLGSGSGEFLSLASALGVKAEGIEPHAGYSAYCVETLNLNVRTGTLETCSYAPQTFDLIRLSHVLEHMRDPIGTLKTLRDWLTPDGVLYVEVPNIEVEAQERVRGKLFHYGHINNFTPVTLRALAAMAGLAERADTAARTEGHTGIFFEIADATRLNGSLVSEHGKKMHDIMAEHNARLVPRPKQHSAVGRFLLRASQRGRDVLRGALLRTPKAIANDAARRLRQDLA